MLGSYIYIGIIVLLLIIIVGLVITNRKKVKFYIDKNELIENKYHMQLKHYESYTNNYDKYRKFKHDIRNKLIILDILINKKEYEKAKEELNTIKEEFEAINILNYTNNLMLDSVLYNINEICKIKSIDFKVKVNILNSENNKLQDFIEFLIYSLSSIIEVAEKEIICKIKENNKNLLLYLEITSINQYNKGKFEEITHKLKEKSKALNITIEFESDDDFKAKCLL